MTRNRIGMLIWVVLAAVAVGYVAANSMRLPLPTGITWADVRFVVGGVGLVLWFAGLTLRNGR